MKTIFILRHAKSSWEYPDLSDHDRPLNKRGKRDAPRIGEFLREHGLVPDLIISSTAKRAKTTVKRVVKSSGYDGEVELTSSFFHASPPAYIAALQRVSDDFHRVMVVGHNPGLEELVETLTGKAVVMTTGAFAHVSLPIDSWSELERDTEGNLIGLWSPKEMV
jgi:phosphohistidine phosphatase